MLTQPMGERRKREMEKGREQIGANQESLLLYSILCSCNCNCKGLSKFTLLCFCGRLTHTLPILLWLICWGDTGWGEREKRFFFRKLEKGACALASLMPIGLSMIVRCSTHKKCHYCVCVTTYYNGGHSEILFTSEIIVCCKLLTDISVFWRSHDDATVDAKDIAWSILLSSSLRVSLGKNWIESG